MVQKIMKADCLSFEYKDSSEGIRDINFEISKGEVILLTGNSGCGKSTLLKCLNGLIPAITEGNLKGELFINDKNYKDLKMHELNSEIGSVFQNPRSQFFTDNTTSELVFPMENYGYSKPQMQQKLSELVKTFGLEKLIDKNIFLLSSGERQMVALASALTMDQQVVLFDEPSANLDYGNAMKLGQIISWLKERGITVIVADHRFYYLNGIIDRVFFMDKGKLHIYDNEAAFKKIGYDTRSFDIFSLEVPFVEKIADSKKTVCASIQNTAYKHILRNVNLELKKGEVTVLVGNNGAGKTTIVKLLCGLYPPVSGQIFVDGKLLWDSSMSVKQYMKTISVLFQETNPFALSIAMNVASCDEKDMNRERIKESLKKAGLLEKVDTLIHKEDTYITQELDDDGVQLSGGEIQKLLLAKAIYKDGSLLVLDEPTSALDPIAESKIYEEYNRFANNKTAVFISHRLASTKFCDRILFLENGKIIEEGSHKELMEKGGKYREIFDIQSHYYAESTKDKKDNQEELA